MKHALALLMFCFTAVACADELTVGAKAPAFSLTNAVDGSTYRFAPGDGKLSVVFFTCNQCPYAKAFEPRLIEIAKQYQARGVNFYAIDPNDENIFADETVAN